MNEEERAKYYRRQEEEEQLQKMSLTHVCWECGSSLITPWDTEHKIIILVCAKDRSHRGYTKRETWTQAFEKGEPIPIEIQNQIEKKRRKQMVNQLGEEKTKALARYVGTRTLSQQEATEIVKTIWPDAPEQDVLKAAIVCHQYGLNPLMGHLFLIPFTDHKTGKKTWARVLAIKAARLIVGQDCKYGFVDGPRLMTKREQESIIGEVDDTHFHAIVVLEDSEGNRFPGYGAWDKRNDPYGSEKGNTGQNMAFIRAERHALDRINPGKLPTGIEVIQGEYADVETPQITEDLEQLPDVGQPTTQPVEKATSGSEPPPAKSQAQPVTPIISVEPSRRMPTNPRDFQPQSGQDVVNGASYYFGLEAERILTILEVTDRTEIKSPVTAWQVILHNQGIKAPK